MRLLAAVPIAAVALAVAGCGSETIDHGDAEELVRKGMAAANAGDPTSVECPDDVEPEKGATMVCHAKTAGDSYTFTLRVEEAEGGTARMTIVDAKKG